MSLTSRERVLMSLNHMEPDRVPIDIGSSRATGINANAYNELKKYLGIETDTILFDVKQLLAEIEFDILAQLGSDVVILPRLKPSLGLSIDEFKPGTLPLGGGNCLLAKDYNPIPLKDGSLGIYDVENNLIAKRASTSLYYDEVFHPLEDAQDESDIDKISLPSISSAELTYLRNKAKYLYEKTDFLISGATSFSLFEKGLKDWGYENFLIKLYEEPELIEYYLNKLTDAYIIMMEKYVEVLGDYVDVVQNNDDFGSQDSLLISPAVYRKFFKGRHAKINDAIKRKKKNMHISMHCCGSIYPIIGDIIESGYDILNPIQKECANMDPKTIKREFGEKVTIWGGACSTQTTLTNGTIDDIIAEAQNMIKIYAPGGGFVFSQIHNIQAGISPQKIISLFETAQKYGIQEFYK